MEHFVLRDALDNSVGLYLRQVMLNLRWGYIHPNRPIIHLKCPKSKNI